MALESRSPMELVYECFVKLGLRYVCVLRDGQFAGLVSRVSTPVPTSVPVLHKHNNKKEPHLLIPSRIIPPCLHTDWNPIIQVHKKAFVKYVKEVVEAQST